MLQIISHHLQEKIWILYSTIQNLTQLVPTFLNWLFLPIYIVFPLD